MISATTARPSAVTPQPLQAALIPPATSVSQGVRAFASRRRKPVLARSSNPSHWVWAENRKMQATMATASTSG